MTELEVLKKISSSLTERKSAAALSNYNVLCNNIAFLNGTLTHALGEVASILERESLLFTNESNLQALFKQTSDMNAMLPIVKRIQENTLSVFSKISGLSTADDRVGIDVETVHVLSKGFTDYNDLVTATRQFIDSVVSDSYQLALLEPKSINYHVLVSLNSFSKYGTKSLIQSLFNSETQAALAEFESLSFGQWKNSHITECKHDTFAKKVDFLLAQFGNVPGIADELKNAFKFSSEFTHIGYTSTFFTTSIGPEVVFGDSVGPYLPSTENFSELKFQILETALKSISTLFIPAIRSSAKRILDPSCYIQIESALTQLADNINRDLESRNSEYYFFVRSGVIGSRHQLPLQCMCGTVRNWLSPHNSSELFCESCGSHFNLTVIDGDGSHVQTSNGLVSIVGHGLPL